MHRPSLVSLAALVVLPALACGSGGGGAIDGGARDGGPPDAGALTASGYCEATATAFCGFYLRCGRLLADSQAECEQVFLESCNARYEPRYADLEAAGLLALSEAGIAACAAHLDTVACDAQAFDLSGPCAGMWIGGQPVGGACSYDVESFVCEPGAVCVLDLSFCGTCTAAAPTGGDCAGDARCGTDDYCDGALCQPRGGPDDACSTEEPCQLGLRCTDGTCRALTYVGEGEACDAERRCPYRASCIGGQCRRDALLDEACGATTACASGRCEGGTCAPLAGDGEACGGPSDCASGYCAAARCEPLPGACFVDGGA